MAAILQRITETKQASAIKEKGKAFLRRTAAALSRCGGNLCCCLFFFLTPFVRFFSIPSPFAAALLASGREKSSFFSLLGIVFSFLLRLVFRVELDLWQYVGLIPLWILLRFAVPLSPAEAAVYAGVAMTPRLIYAAFRLSLMDAVLCFAALPAAMLVTVFVRQGLEQMTTPIYRSLRQGAVLLLFLLLVSGLGYFRLFSINLGHAAAVFFTLLAAENSGSLRGTAIGLLCGIALAFCGHDCRLSFCFCLCGLISGLPVVKKRRWLLVPSALAGNLLAYYTMPLPMPVLDLFTTLLGAFLALMMPCKLRLAASGFLGAEKPRDLAMENTFFAEYISHLRTSLFDLAKALPKPDQRPEEEEADLLGQRLCGECPNREMCWGRSRTQTETLMKTLLSKASRGESLSEDDLPALSLQGCLRTEAIPRAAREALAQLKKQQMALRRRQLQRDITMTHLAATLSTLSQLELLLTGESANDLEAAYKIRTSITQLNLPAKLLYARRVDGRLTAALESEKLLPIHRQLRQLQTHLTDEYGMAMTLCRVDKGHIELEETPPFTPLIGTAALPAGNHTEPGAPCGDSCISRRSDGGRITIALCDGMGHGEKAQQQSQKTLQLLMLLLAAGYTRKQAIVAVNGIMLLQQDLPETFSTLDLADVDLWTGDVSCEKLGACASWIVRGSHLKKVEAASLPIGITEDAEPVDLHFRLHSGDIMVMMSDGVADAFQSEDALKKALLESVYADPQRMADTFLRHALLLLGGVSRDDMTVLAVMLSDGRR